MKKKKENLTGQLIPLSKGIVLAPLHLALIVLVCVLLATVSYLRGNSIGREQSQTNPSLNEEIAPQEIAHPTFNLVPPVKPTPLVPTTEPTLIPKATSTPTPTPTPTSSPSKVVEADSVVNCTFTGSCAGTYQMTRSACSNSACCKIDGNYKVATVSECNAAYQKELEAYEKYLQEFYAKAEADNAAVQQQVAETNTKLLELCRDNARKMYPEYPSGESPEHRNQRMQELNRCFNEYGQ